MAKCKSCGDPASRKCSGCSGPWYCSRKCQRIDWVSHIFDCNPRREINTADYLALAVHENLLPTDTQTCLDYGFTRASTSHNQSYMLGLYIGLVNHLEIKPQTLHQWRLEGTLVQNIKTAFQKLPEQSRGGYYAWFLKNEYVLNTSLPAPPAVELEEFKRAWVLLGGSAADSEAAIKAKIATWSEERQTCHAFYVVLVSGWHPAPMQDMWVNFGYCACHHLHEEIALSRIYKELIEKCTFDDIVAAYETSTLLALFDSKGIHYQHISGLEDVLAGSPVIFKSVWWLKQFVMAEEDDECVHLQPSVRVDYGFINCKDEDEFDALKRLYKQVLDMPQVDPVQLHNASIQGRLFEYLGGQVNLTKKKKKFARLLKNPYPLPNI